MPRATAGTWLAIVWRTRSERWFRCTDALAAGAASSSPAVRLCAVGARACVRAGVRACVCACVRAGATQHRCETPPHDRSQRRYRITASGFDGAPIRSVRLPRPHSPTFVVESDPPNPHDPTRPSISFSVGVCWAQTPVEPSESIAHDTYIAKERNASTMTQSPVESCPRRRAVPWTGRLWTTSQSCMYMEMCVDMCVRCAWPCTVGHALGRGGHHGVQARMYPCGRHAIGDGRYRGRRRTAARFLPCSAHAFILITICTCV